MLWRGHVLNLKLKIMPWISGTAPMLVILEVCPSRSLKLATLLKRDSVAGVSIKNAKL